jgi:dihydroorotate dehydrogenase (NAD+) catalytic subunit
MSAIDALEFIVAGATAVQIGTASFVNPSAAQEIAEEMEQWLEQRGVSAVKSLIGALEV